MKYWNTPKKPLKRQDDTFPQTLQEPIRGPDALWGMALLQRQHLRLFGKPPVEPMRAPKHLAATRSASRAVFNANGVQSSPQTRYLFAILPGGHLALYSS